jgi:molybdopterin-guanine dinucleotide biosynthesis adapter protein
MNRIHIVGRKNHGKTTLVVDLVEEYCRRGVRVGTIKHSRHLHELDSPGKDSHRHRTAGSQPAAIITSDSLGIFLNRDGRDDYQRLQPLYADCQIVLVEGDIDAPSAIKVEVWRAVGGTAPLAAERADIAAIVSDDRPEVAVPVWPRSDLASLADKIWELAGGSGITP